MLRLKLFPPELLGQMTEAMDRAIAAAENAGNERQLANLIAVRGQSLDVVDLQAVQHFTKPPARYTEASLVKALEKEGIGRPSTYASIISTIQDRKYAEKEGRTFHATDIGEVVTDKLQEYFPRIMDVAFTRHMEEQLDKIEEQHLNWVDVLNEFYGPFQKSLEIATEEERVLFRLISADVTHGFAAPELDLGPVTVPPERVVEIPQGGLVAVRLDRHVYEAVGHVHHAWKSAGT